jgi:3-hydroxyisobutyrate dehydrogenase-like beta-hydroxyacid dehydrogenase
MCKKLIEKGNLDKPLKIYNRTIKMCPLSSVTRPSRLQLKKPSQNLTSSSSAVTKSDIIFISLGDDAAITENVNKILESNVKDKLIVDCSTVHPNTTAMTAKAIEAHCGKFVACPVFGAPAMAQCGQLVCVCRPERGR